APPQRGCSPKVIREGCCSSSMGWLQSQSVTEIELLDLLRILVLAPPPGFINPFPAAKVSASFIVFVIAAELARRKSAVEVFAEHAVLFLIEGQSALKQFHLDDKFMNLHRVLLTTSTR